MIPTYKCSNLIRLFIFFYCLETVGKNKDTIETTPSNKKTNGTSKEKQKSCDNLYQVCLHGIISYLASTKSIQNNSVVSVLKSDTISVLKPDDHLDNFFADTNKNLTNESSSSSGVQLNSDDLNRIAENAVRYVSFFVGQ